MMETYHCSSKRKREESREDVGSLARVSDYIKDRRRLPVRTAPFPFHQLPVELQLSVLEHLDVRGRLQFSMCNRSCQSLVVSTPQLWRVIDMTPAQDDYHHRHLFDRHPRMARRTTTNPRLFRFRDDRLAGSVYDGLRIGRPRQEHEYEELEEDVYEEDEEQEQAGTSLSMNSGMLPKGVRHLPQVHTRTLSTLLDRLTKSCLSSMGTLVLDGTNVDYRSLERVCRDLPNLSELSIRYCPYLTLMDVVNALVVVDHATRTTTTYGRPLPKLNKLSVERLDFNSMSVAFDRTLQALKTLERWAVGGGVDSRGGVQQVRLDVASCRECDRKILARRLLGPCTRCHRDVPSCFGCRRDKNCGLCFDFLCNACCAPITEVASVSGAGGADASASASASASVSGARGSSSSGDANWTVTSCSSCQQDCRNTARNTTTTTTATATATMLLLATAVRMCKRCARTERCHGCRKWYCYRCQAADVHHGEQPPPPPSGHRPKQQQPATPPVRLRRLLSKCMICRRSVCAHCHPEPFQFSCCTACYRGLLTTDDGDGDGDGDGDNNDNDNDNDNDGHSH